MTSMPTSSIVNKTGLGHKPGRAALITLGIMLIVGFFFPIVAPNPKALMGGGGSAFKMVFLNIEILSAESLPFMARFMAIYPLLAGVVLIVAALAAPLMVRSIVILVLGLLMYVNMFSSDVSLSQMMRVLPPGLKGILAIQLLISIGMTCLLAGVLGRRRAATSKLASVLGMIGGGLFLAGLLLPLLPSEIGGMLIVVPFKLFGVGEGMITASAVFMLGTFILWGVSGVLSLMNTPGRDADSAMLLNRKAFTCFLSGVATFAIMFLVPMLRAVENPQGFTISMMIILKVTLWMGGLFLLLPFGLADLAAALQPPTRPQAACPQPVPPIVPVPVAPIPLEGVIPSEPQPVPVPVPAPNPVAPPQASTGDDIADALNQMGPR